MKRADRNLTVTPKVNTRGVADGMRGAGTKASQQFHQEFQTHAQRVGANIGTAIGTVIGKSMGVPINAGRWLDVKAFHAIGRSIGGILSTGIKVGLAGASVAIGAVLYGGFQRIKTMDTAKQVLKAMGLDPASIKTVMADVEKVVKGTPISLPDAFGAAANFIASGVKQGPELIKILTDAADVAGAFAAPFSSVVDIFSQIVANSGVMTGEIEERFRALNIPIAKWVQDTKHITAEAYYDLREKHQIGLADIEAAIEAHAPGMAKALGNTIEGASQNVLAAAGRLGQKLIAAIFGGNMDDASTSMVDTMKSISTQLDNMSAWVQRNAPQIIESFGAIASNMGSAASFALSFAAGLLHIDAEFNRLAANPFVRIMMGPAGAIAFRGQSGEDLRKRADEEDAEADRLYALKDANDALIDSFQKGIEKRADAARFTVDLGESISKIKPESWWGKPIIAAPTSEDIQRIRDAGFTVEQIPGSKDVVLVPVTDKATTEFNAWLEQQKRKPITPPVDPDTPPGDKEMDGFIGQWSQAIIAPPVTPQLDNANLTMQRFIDQWSTAIITPQVAPGSYTPGTNPLNFGGALGTALGGAQATGGLPPISGGGGRGLIGGGNQSIVYQEMLRRGFPESEWSALQALINSESGFQTSVRNPTSGAYGIFQFLGHEGDKYGAMGAYSANPADQSRAGLQYIIDRYGSPSAAWRFKQANNWYDEGGWLPPGYQWVINDTGQPELVLNQDQVQQMADQGVDPNTLIHGTGQGAAPGPPPLSPEQQQYFQAGMGALSQVGGLDSQAGRTVGYIPTAVQAGANTVAGTSFVAGILDLGNQVVHGLIDTGAEAAKTAISMAASAGAGAPGAPGAGAAGPIAGAAAGLGIDMAANVGKRLSTYGFQLLSIGADAMIENLFPFGAPRWLGYDYTQFRPQLNLRPITAAVTTAEKTAAAQRQQAPPMPPGGQHMPTGAAEGIPIPPGPTMQPGGPVSPTTMPGMQAVVGQPQGTPPATQSVTPGAGTPTLGPQPAPPPEPTQGSPTDQFQDPNYWLGLFGFDEGGWLMPDTVGINLTKRPEPVFTDAQWQTMQRQIDTADQQSQFGVHIQNLYAVDANDVKRQIDSQQRLAVMRYSGRPYG